MKKLISWILVILLTASMIPAASAAGSEEAEAAENLYELGLFRGTGTNPDGTPIFALEQTPTRNQAIIMLVRLLGKEDEALTGTWEIPFTDVSDSMRPYIGYAYTNGLTNGTSATTYSGTNPIRFNQYITFVLRALGYESGKDFEVSTSWEFSDKIGLTDGSYSAATAAFTRGDVAKISHSALSVSPKGSSVTLLEQLKEEGALAKYKAWYEVDELGHLWMKTNFSPTAKAGYWILVELHFRDGSTSYDSQSHIRVPIEYDFNALLSFWDGRTVISSVDFYVFEDASMREDFWDAWSDSGSFNKAFELFSDRLVGHFILDNDIRVEKTTDQFELTAFSLSRDEAKQQETYKAFISSEITQEGEYGLVYKGSTGGQNAGLSYIGRGDGSLTFTREINHFAEAGARGTFYITHNRCTLKENGDILCTVTMSSGYKYQF